MLKACGSADGVVNDPRACTFDPRTLRCRGPDGPACLTDAEIAVLEKWYAEPRNSRGQVLVPAVLPRGSETFWPGVVWKGADGAEASVSGFGRDFLRYMAFPEDPGDRATLERFDFDRDPPRMTQAAALFNATNPDLSGFRDRGGKLLMYHGWADALVPPSVATAYWESVTAKMGNGAAVSGLFRLFMIPGFGHCGLQPGPGGLTESGLDPLTALEQWVERGVAPDVLVTTVYGADGKAERVRPVCPYPTVARLKGGDANNPANHACVAK